MGCSSSWGRKIERVKMTQLRAGSLWLCTALPTNCFVGVSTPGQTLDSSRCVLRSPANTCSTSHFSQLPGLTIMFIKILLVEQYKLGTDLCTLCFKNAFKTIWILRHWQFLSFSRRCFNYFYFVVRIFLNAANEYEQCKEFATICQ